MLPAHDSYCAMLLLPEVSEEDTVSAAIFKQQILDRLDRDGEAGVVLNFPDAPLYLFPPAQLSPKLRNEALSRVPPNLAGSFLAAFTIKTEA